MEDTAILIIEECKKCKGTNPVEIFNAVAKKDFVRMHGPEHHVLDGASILVAFKNAGGKIDLEEGLKWMITHGLKMPGGQCAYWGVCGAVTSIGTAIAFIDTCGPLSNDGSWGKKMLFTSKAIQRMGEINGPRCCKRDAYVSFEAAIEFINANYGVKLESSEIKCSFSGKNQQCIGNRCPFNKVTFLKAEKS